jgi:hypothetical protein
MTESNPLSHEMQENLQFVRNAVEAKNRPPHASNGPLIVWAIYTLICVPAYDYLPRHGVEINLVGWLLAAFISFVMGKRAARRTGQFDQALINRLMLHWFGGIVLMFTAIFGLALGKSGLNGLGTGQVSVIIVGILYFTAGVHLPESRFMRWAGPVVVLAGIGIGWLPALRWTAMGLVFTTCLLIPVLFGGRNRTASAI